MLGLRLSHEHAIKRVFVGPGQETSADGMVRRDGKQFESFPFQVSSKIGRQVCPGWKLAQSNLGGNFPKRMRH